MAKIDKTQLQTYNFLSENKSIEDIKQQPNIEVKEKSRHGGKGIKIFNKIEKEPLWVVVNDNQSEENEIFYDTIENFDTEKSKYTYNFITTYDEKQKKKTSIGKIYEEILPIENKVFFITTFVHINQSISEEIMYIHHFKNGDIEVIKQLKQYENINKYKDDFSLTEKITNNKNNMSFFEISIKDFLKGQQELKSIPTWMEIGTWIITWLIIPLAVVAINLIHPPLLTISLVIGGIVTVLRGGTELLSPTAKKVWSWFSNKCSKKFEQEKNKKERQSIIKNLSVDKLETKLQTQYEILKQELDNKKEKNPDKLISINKINHNSNSILENSNIESLNPSNFDSSIRNTVNQQEPQTPTSSNHNWNKVKCLFT